MKYEKKIKEYFIGKIREKADKNKELLSSLYDTLLSSIETLDVSELMNLNDLDLLLNYLDYVNSFKNRKVAESLLKVLDIAFNFDELRFKDKAVLFNSDIISSDQSEAKEEAFFSEHSNSGGFIFEDYGDEEELENDTAIQSGVDNDIQDGEDKLTSLVRELEDVVNPVLDDDEEDPFSALENLLDEINEEVENASDEGEDKKGDEPSGYDFFNDFTDDADEPDYVDDEFDGFDELSDWEQDREVVTDEDRERLSLFTGDSSDEADKEEEDKEGNNTEEDKEFENEHQKELEAKWGMFKSIIPGWTLESYETMPLTSLVTLIRRGMIQLPDDRTLLTDEMVDFLLQQQILTERPVKKTEEEVDEGESSDTASDSILEGKSEEEVDESDLESLQMNNPHFEFSDVTTHKHNTRPEKKKALFKDNIASQRADSADELRKKIGKFGKDTLTGLFNKTKKLKADTVAVTPSSDDMVESFEDSLVGTDSAASSMQDITFDDLDSTDDLVSFDNLGGTEDLADFGTEDSLDAQLSETDVVDNMEGLDAELTDALMDVLNDLDMP